MLSNRKMLNYSFNFFNANNMHLSIFHEEHKTKTRERITFENKKYDKMYYNFLSTTKH